MTDEFGVDRTRVVRLRRHLAADPQAVFDAWTVPRVMSRWLFVGPTSRITEISADLRVGGGYSIVERPDGFEDVDHFGEYRELDAPHRLAFTLETPAHFPERTHILIEIAAAEGGGGSEMTFTQHGVAPEVVQGSWERMFDSLEQALANP